MWRTWTWDMHGRTWGTKQSSKFIAHVHLLHLQRNEFTMYGTYLHCSPWTHASVETSIFVCRGPRGRDIKGKDILEALWTMYFLKKSVCGSPGYADLWSMCHVPCLGFQILHLLFCAGCTWGRGTWETCKGRGRRGKAQKTARFYESSGPKTAPQSSMEQDEGGKFRLFCCPPSGTRIPREVKWENVRVRWMWDVKWMDVEDVMNGRQGRDGRGRRGGRGTWRTWRTWGRDALQVILHFF